MKRFADWYGADPLHLAALLGSFALAGYAADRMLAFNPVGVTAWFLGAVVGHDLVLIPLYSLADRPLSWLATRDRSRRPIGLASRVNYVRVPAALSLLLLLVWFPLIFRLPRGYRAATGRSPDAYLTHWLAVTGALFLISAVALAIGIGRQSRAEHRSVGH